MNTNVYTFPLPWSTPPLTLNDRFHRMKEQKLTREIRQTARRLADGLDPFVRPTVTLIWLVTTRHRRDVDNIVPTLKALCDGVVDAGLAADDTPEFMHKTMPIIAYAKGHPTAPGLFLTLWEAGEMTPDEKRALGEVEL
ncbi:RusA family crossover junction endodeoxyribonuclease [Microbacterium caowuchunii]|uniref:Uncharacterized protein n=1 Tax=Microbacterium caowuchunii TaxID=2614638 RepID=A0A5N0TFC5_9MICO|nr:hypothetical protein [Microbacterium caowuchunii]KAA9133730.1 hypothetical protein F6B40_08230 [Microbacterium caowuchunii]